MAYGILPKPGTDAGPCFRACEHVDCALTRRMAQRKCRLCKQEIGYEQPYYNDPLSAFDTALIDQLLVHGTCIWAEHEKRLASAMEKISDQAATR